uniref:Uncharacterized protein n=1 Tax=Arundo donax TaxID=35708 RepID=A0A0A9CBE9_ARUDO
MGLHDQVVFSLCWSYVVTLWSYVVLLETVFSPEMSYEVCFT